MTTGRLMTTLSVLGLGFAVAGAAPVLAQNYTTGPPPPPAPPAAEMQHPSYPTQHFAKRRTYEPQSATAQDAAVERLNEQSLQAARAGQTFMPSGGQ